jgi:uncharacterized protein YceK
MRKFMLAVLLLGGCTTARTATSQAPTTASPGVAAPAERIPTDIRRLTIIVRDMDKSLALYRDVLGLKVNYDIMTTTSGVALPAGEPGAAQQ